MTIESSRSVKDIREIFPEGIERVGQFIGELRVIAVATDGVTSDDIVERLRVDGAKFLPMIACDENGGVPDREVVEADLVKLHDMGVLRADTEGRYCFTEQGFDLLRKEDKRQGYE